MRRRTTIDAYVPGPSRSDYVFFTAWPWAKHAEVNPPRARFIDVCRRAPELTFEGGFAPRRRRDVPDVLAYSAPRRYPIREYIEKLSRSAVAFNNPAVHGCLGWKLGEYLALGKAIITLPLERPLPAPLEHGVHIHVIDGSEASIDAALDRLRRDDVYRRTLERNARQWYEQNLAPERLARRLLELMDARS
jgi:glycosyltransferase involved in cell wall biosynthesis